MTEKQAKKRRKSPDIDHDAEKHSVEVRTAEHESTWKKYQDSPLNPCLRRHLASINIDRPSPIQLQLINAIMSSTGKRIKRNVFACSPTGTGKTLAYVLPLLHFLTQDIRPYFALILAPTRELAFQIYEIIRVLTGTNADQSNSSTMIKTLLMIGGGKTGLQTNETEIQGFWNGRPNIVVATPGRMVEQLTKRNHLEHTGHRSALRFDFLVLDEADLLISSTFANQLRDIIQAIDEHGIGNNRQTLVLSATLTSALEQLKNMFMDKDDDGLKPVSIDLLPTLDEIKLDIAKNPNLDQRYVICPEAMKPAYLVQALSDISFKQAIIFCSSTRQATLLHKLMINLGFDEPDVKCHPVLLVGNKDQKQRLKSLERFKSLKSRIMVATGGLAGRGLDLPQVDLVIQYNCPTNPVDYIHRVGRTCRKIDFARIDEVEKIRANIKSLQLRSGGGGSSSRGGAKADSASTANSGVDASTDNDNTTRINIIDCVAKTDRLDDDDDDKNQQDNEDANGPPAATASSSKLKRATMSVAATKYYGKSILFITQYDIELLKNIESFVNIRLTEEDELDADNITNIIKPVAIALKDAELNLLEEQAAELDKRSR